MSGWIKFEKDLRTDPRFLRMCKAYVTQERINPVTAATLLSGGLLNLWCYADTHIREDDTLDIGADEVDELIGIQGFAALMPEDWLEVLDTHRVKLPGFQEHNGTDAKKRALTQKRVARHRVRNVTQERSNHSSSSNVVALPDQTRLDQTKTRPRVERANVAEPNFERISNAYPKFDGRQNWGAAEHHWRIRLEEGLSEDDLVASVERYARFVAAGGVSAPKFVLTPATFFSASDKPWLQPWTPPATKAEAAQDANIAASKAWAEGSNAAQ